MQFIIILTIVALFLISIWDDLTATIPHTLTIILLGLGIASCIIDNNFSFGLTGTIFGIILVSQILMFFLFGEDAIGGGDVKILSISMLFLHTTTEILIYSLALAFVSALGYAKAKVKNESHLRFGPYMALSLMIALILPILDTTLTIIISLAFITFLNAIEQLFILKETREKYYDISKII